MRQFDLDDDTRRADQGAILRGLTAGAVVLSVFAILGIIVYLIFLTKRVDVVEHVAATPASSSNGTAVADPNTALGGALDGTIAIGKVRDYLTTFGIQCPDDRRPVQVYFHANGSVRDWACALYDDIPIPPGGVLAGTLGNASFAPVGPFTSCGGPGLDCNITWYGLPYPVCVCTARPPAPEPVVNIFYGSNATNATNTTVDGVVYGPLNATQFKSLPTPGVVNCTGADTIATWVVDQIWPDLECAVRAPVPAPAPPVTEVTMGGVIIGLSNETDFAAYPPVGVVNCTNKEVIATWPPGQLWPTITCEPRALPTFEDNTTIILVESNITSLPLGGVLIGTTDDADFADYPPPGVINCTGQDMIVTFPGGQLWGDPVCVPRAPVPEPVTVVQMGGVIIGPSNETDFAAYPPVGVTNCSGQDSVWEYVDGQYWGNPSCTPRAAFDGTVGGPVLTGTTNNISVLEGPAAGLYGGAGQDCAFNVSDLFLKNISCAARPAYDPETIVLAGDSIGSPGANELINRFVTAATYRLPCDLTVIGKGLVTGNATECVDSFVNTSHSLGNALYFSGNASSLTLLPRGVAGTYQSSGTLDVPTFNDAGILTGVVRGSAAVLLNTTAIGGTALTGTIASPSFIDKGFGAGSCGNATHRPSRLVWDIYLHLTEPPQCATFAASTSSNETTFLGTPNQVILDTSTPDTIIFTTPQDTDTAADFQVASITATSASHTGPIGSRLGTAQHTVTATRPNTEYYVAGGNGHPVLQVMAVAPGIQYIQSGMYTNSASADIVSNTGVRPAYISFGFGSIALGGVSDGAAGSTATGYANYLVAANTSVDVTPLLRVYGTMYAGPSASYTAGATAGNNQFVVMGTATDTTTFAQIEFKNNAGPHANLHLASTGTTRQFVSFGGYRTGGAYVVGATTDDVFLLERNGNTFSLQYQPPGTAGTATTPVILQAQTRSLAYITTPLEARSTFRAGVPQTYGGSSEFVFFGSAFAARPPITDYVILGSTLATTQIGAITAGKGFLSFNAARVGTDWQSANAVYDGKMLLMDNNDLTVMHTPTGSVGTPVVPVELARFKSASVTVTPLLEALSTFRAGPPTTYAGSSPFVFFGPDSLEAMPVIDLVSSGATRATVQLGAPSGGFGFLSFDAPYETSSLTHRIGSATFAGKVFSKLGSDLIVYHTAAGTVGTAATLVELARFTATTVTVTPMLEALTTFRAGPSATYAGSSSFVLFGPDSATTSPVLDFVVAGASRATVQVGTIIGGTGFLAFDAPYETSSLTHRIGSASFAGKILSKFLDDLIVYHTAAGTVGTAATLVELARFASTGATFTPVTNLLGGFRAGPASTRAGTNLYSIGGDATINLEIYATGQSQPRGNAYAFLATGDSHVAFDAYHHSGAYRFASASQAGLLLRKTASTFAVQFNPVATTPVVGNAFTPETRFSVTSATTMVHNSLLVESTLGSSHIRLRTPATTRPHAELSTFSTDNSYLAFDVHYEGGWVFTGASSTRGYLWYKVGNLFALQSTTTLGSGGAPATPQNVMTVNNLDVTITTAPIISAFAGNAGKQVVVDAAGKLTLSTPTMLTLTGTGNYTIPMGAKNCRFSVTAAGGSGGGGDGFFDRGGGGGGAGAFATDLPCEAGDNIFYAAGAGGASVGTVTVGQPGATTTFYVQRGSFTGPTATLNGGGGGGAGATGIAGLGGTFPGIVGYVAVSIYSGALGGTAGTAPSPGADGGSVFGFPFFGGKGGSASVSVGAGGGGAASIFASGGTGGSVFASGGVAGTLGSGGGGGSEAGNSGAGGAGAIRIEYTT